MKYKNFTYLFIFFHSLLLKSAYKYLKLYHLRRKQVQIDDIIKSYQLKNVNYNFIQFFLVKLQ
jgi:hypothetical protein